MENRKVTKEAMDGLIAVHKTLSLFDSGSGAQSLLQTMGKCLRDGSMTPDDVADIIEQLFDEEADKETEEVFEQVGEVIGEALMNDPNFALAVLLGGLANM